MKVTRETLEALEFPFVRGLLAARTATPLGSPLALALEPLADPRAVAARLDETDEAVRLIEKEGGLPLRGIEPVVEILEAARPEGGILTGAEILAAVDFCQLVEAVRARRQKLREEYPILGAQAALLPDFQPIVKAIAGRIAPGGELEDSASPELARIRARIHAATGTLRARLEAILARSGADKTFSDFFVTERGGRFVLPVRSDAPAPVKGIVHGGSSSGATLFIEPLATVDLNNELVRLRDDEAAEIERILRDWTGRLRERLEDLFAAVDGIARLDLAQACGHLARDLRAVRPEFEEGRGIEIAKGRHPLLEKVLATSGGRMVPVDLFLPAGSSTLIVSGPNAGGKTVVLKTAGLLALMAHSGLRVPAADARFPWLRQVLVDIGDRQSLEGSLSTFSAHIQNLQQIVSTLTPPALVLIDEIGTGTDPVEGGALAISLLERLRAGGALTIATTHHGPVKLYGIETPGVASAAVEFDEATLAPTFRLLQGIAGASSGLAIAARLGLDPRIVEDARRRIAPGEREAESYLERLRDLVANLESDRAELELLRARLEAETRRAREQAIRSDNERAERFRGELAQALEEFRAKAREHIKGVADKRQTIRLENERAKREAELRRDHERLMRESAPLEPLPRGREARRAGRGPGAGGEGSAGGAVLEPFVVAPGRTVLVGPYEREGKVEAVEGSMVIVLVGGARFRVRMEDCLPPETGSAPEPVPLWKAPRPAAHVDEPAPPSVPVEVNLIGMRVEEGMEALDKFLDDAIRAGHREVRVIHGFGTGRLRTAVRNLLSRHPARRLPPPRRRLRGRGRGDGRQPRGIAFARGRGRLGAAREPTRRPSA